MRMSYLVSIAYACSILLASATSSAAPPDDGRCDVLVGATPSLYGLCLAYWATQDNGNDVASSKVLTKYIEKYDPATDPYMPGLGCPCWTPDELVTWEDTRSGQLFCVQIEDPNQAGWFDSTGYTVYTYFDDAANNPYSCEANAPSLGDVSAVDRQEYINQVEFDACYSQAQASAQAVGCQ